ncbi:hypothetical protein BVY04_03495 [bacterium M21]|nr:hypothetical protein BVY04_03495 [bacterium M21]
MRTLSICLLITCISASAAPVTNNDTKTVLSARKGLVDALLFAKKNPDVFPTKEVNGKELLSRAQRMVCWQTWQTFMDHMVSLDTQSQRYFGLYRKNIGKAERKRPFKLGFAAFLAQYRYALEFIQLAENNPTLHTVLNEPVPELGLPAQTYAQMKIRYLNVAIASKFTSLAAVNRAITFQEPTITEAIAADKKAIWKASLWHGPLQTLKNAGQVTKDLSFKAWFPLQKEVSDWMGDTKVWRFKTSLLTEAQINNVQTKLEPGDILLVRHEWYLSNVGLPGFWPHAAIYVGTPQQRQQYFDTPEVKAWIKTKSPNSTQGLDALLLRTSPEAYERNLKLDGHQKQPVILEAISEGVMFTSLNHCLEADSAAVLRPRVSKITKAQALLRAFHYSGRPYDFNFDFQTDASLVCTELVYKSYEPSNGNPGLNLPLVEMMGRNVMPANQLAILFDQQYGKPEQQLDFVTFLDGFEWENKAILQDVNAFRKSHTRPKWHIWTHRKKKK